MRTAKISPEAKHKDNVPSAKRSASLIHWIRLALNGSRSRKSSLRRKVSYYDEKKLRLFFAEFDVKYKLARG
nr:hypothetical protein [Candidatus Njordarchaeota archaeon]